MATNVAAEYTSAAIATFSGLSPFDATSSITANAKIPAAAGQWPIRSGYSRGAGNGPRAAVCATQATARARARHGLNALKMSPNSTLSGTSKSQKITNTKLGAKLFVAVCDPASPA